MTIPIALTIAGSDSSGGAGIQADLKTFAACGVYGASVITALTAQNSRGVSGVHVVPPDFVTAQLDAVFGDLDVRAVKTGMLARADVIDAVVAALRRWTAPNLVVDPVLIATSGGALLEPDAIATLRETLLPLARLITPNLPEAAALLGDAVAVREDDIARQGQALLALGASAVLIKGGHGSGAESIDYLFDGDGIVRFGAPRLATRNTHGTGGTLASAIAAGLAQGIDLPTAVRRAKDYVTAAIAAADRLNVGRGRGPLHHFHVLDFHVLDQLPPSGRSGADR
jgi:hydroxymethylpyrimidine/phosphomethylpyrimidine kinase